MLAHIYGSTHFTFHQRIINSFFLSVFFLFIKIFEKSHELMRIPFIRDTSLLGLACLSVYPPTFTLPVPHNTLVPNIHFFISAQVSWLIKDLIIIPLDILVTTQKRGKCVTLRKLYSLRPCYPHPYYTKT